MGIFSFLGTGKKRQALTEAFAEGATIVDVRSKAEFQSGHFQGAVNVPLQEVDSHLAKWQKHGKTVIFCCASGIRSGNATNIAKKAGISAINGGGWQRLAGKLSG